MAETERLKSSSELIVINATAVSVDVYVNFVAQPVISDPKPLVLSPIKDELNAPAFVVKDDFATPYGVYTFSVRRKGQPNPPILGEASIDMQQGHSYTGVFHETARGQFQFSIYENDLSTGQLARLTVIHAAAPERITWQIRPNGEDPRIPADVRSGTLEQGQWQIARNIVDNDYIIEFFADGQLIARNPDLDLARAKNFVVTVFGDPQPTGDPELLVRPIVYQELEFDPGFSEPTEVTPPAPPLSSTDSNAPVELTCAPISVWETNGAATVVTARDPDGKVVSLTIDDVIPKVGGIDLIDSSFEPSVAIGGPASVVMTIKSDVPRGTYEIVVGANRGSLAHQGTCAVVLEVEPITIARLQQVVDDYTQSGHIGASTSDALQMLLSGAQAHVDAGNLGEACQYLKDALSLLGAHKGKAVKDVAHDHVERETKALRADLGCG